MVAAKEYLNGRVDGEAEARRNRVGRNVGQAAKAQTNGVRRIE